MEQSLKNRLTYGPLMLLGLFIVFFLDHAVQKWTLDWVIVGEQKHRIGVGGVGFLLLFLFILPIATVELAKLFTAESVRPYRVLSAFGSASLVIHAFLTQFDWFKPYAASSLAFIVVGVMLLAALLRAIDRQTQEAIHRMAGTVLAVLYLGGLAWFLMSIRVKVSIGTHGGLKFQGTTMKILLMLMVVKFTDIGAYFGGRKFGKHKLIFWLSPGKTWEGLGFGLLTAGLIGAAIAPAIERLSFMEGFWFGVLIGGIGQAGDLLESMMKRDAEVKDSGTLVPGFGGILDIIDSPLLAAPFAYLVFSML
ncbi:MAG: phosphatidate cytidylyltransferase [Tepidisphaeraceae bacterium]